VPGPEWALKEVMNTLLSPQQLAICYRIYRPLILLGAIAVDTFAPWTGVAIAEQPQRTIVPQVARSDFAAAQALMNQIAALSPDVRAEEAARAAECVYNSAGQLRREYGVIWPPLFNNVLVNSGIRKRGLCFQWAEDLLVTLDALKLTSLELHWGEADAGTWQESNCVVVTAKAQPFNTGIIFDCWRHSGHLYWTEVGADKVTWVENSAYAAFVRAKSATAANRHVAFQSKISRKGKPRTD
jgi:hypothetical protein